MIKIESRITCKNTGLVVIELGGINSNGNGNIHKLSGKISTISNFDKFLNFKITAINDTLLINSFIWILIFGDDSFIFDIFIRADHISTITAVIAIGGGAIHKLLCGEANQRLSFDLVERLHGSNGSKGPARPTRPLVFYIRDESFFYPVYLAIGLNVRLISLLGELIGLYPERAGLDF